MRQYAHPNPRVDEVLQDMTQSSVVSKLDLKWGYHQLELSEEAQGITTFTTHTGLYRYKRLLFENIPTCHTTSSAWV